MHVHLQDNILSIGICMYDDCYIAIFCTWQILYFFQYYHMTFQSIFKNGDVWVIKFVAGTWLVHDEIFHEYNETISTSAGCNHIEPIFYHALHIHLRS